MMDNIFGSILLEIIGASVKWGILNIISIFRRKRKLTFKEVWKGKVSDNHFDKLALGFSNILIGFSVIIICILIILFA